MRPHVASEASPSSTMRPNALPLQCEFTTLFVMAP